MNVEMLQISVCIAIASLFHEMISIPFIIIYVCERIISCFRIRYFQVILEKHRYENAMKRKGKPLLLLQLPTVSTLATTAQLLWDSYITRLVICVENLF